MTAEKHIQLFSKIAYATMLVPFANVLLVSYTMMLITAVLVAALSPLLIILGIIAAMIWYKVDSKHRDGTVLNQNSATIKNITMLYLYITAVLIVMVGFIINTELMIRWSAPLIQPGEDEWTLGQTLAMFLLFLPMRDLLETFFGSIFRAKTAVWTSRLKSLMESGINSLPLPKLAETPQERDLADGRATSISEQNDTKELQGAVIEGAV